MDGSETQEAQEGLAQNSQDTAPEAREQASHDQASKAAEGLRDQIAALRQRVRDAQDTLRDHKRRQETRTFKP